MVHNTGVSGAAWDSKTKDKQGHATIQCIRIAFVVSTVVRPKSPLGANRVCVMLAEAFVLREV